MSCNRSDSIRRRDIQRVRYPKHGRTQQHAATSLRPFRRTIAILLVANCINLKTKETALGLGRYHILHILGTHYY